MYTLKDTNNEAVMFSFENDGSILNERGRVLGSVRDGVVCDKDGTPTRVTVEGNAIVWHGVNPGPVVRAYGVIIVDVGDGNTPVGIVEGARSNAEIMIAAAAYWEFVLMYT